MDLFAHLFPKAVTGAARRAAVRRRLDRAEAEAKSEGIMPPSRRDASVSVEQATSLHAVFRGLEILTGSVSQLSIDAKRQGKIVENPPLLLRSPSQEYDRSDFIEDTVMSLAVSGNFYWQKKRAPGSKEVLALELWNPFQADVTRDPKTGRRTYWYQGQEVPAADVIHRARNRALGQVKGRSVFQAAREDLGVAVRTRDYSAGVFDPGMLTEGVLKSEQALNAKDARDASRLWYGQDLETGEPLPDANMPGRIRVLGKGLSYESITISPKDVQWLEGQNFNITMIARMLGVPASLMLATVEGKSQNYSNVEQDWLAFTRFTLMGYLRKIESAFTEILPTGQTAVFNIESLLRADTKTRYESHSLALGRWMVADEIRAIENMPQLTPEQRAELDATPATSPAHAQGVTP